MSDWIINRTIRLGNIKLGYAQIMDMLVEVELLRNALLTLIKMLDDLNVDIPKDIQKLKEYIKK